jgi:hypothetical protein
MPEDHIRYDILAQEALRGVVRKVLAEVAKTGLPGEHHFFISFVTRAPGVRMSQRLLEQYDKEMTIVLQNQFWDLKVTEVGFEVGLSFDGHPEMLGIPFAAIKGFFDPSVPFGLQFDPVGTPGSEAEPAAAPAGDANKLAAVPSARPAKSAAPDKPAPPPDAEGGDVPAEPPGEKVVSLDSFRKKP